MSETILSPGTVVNENDRSFVTTQPIEPGAAIIGPTVKGPVEKPTFITSYSDYVNRFGTTFTSGSQSYTYFTSISAYNYFENGGTSLLVTRVTSGSFTPATSSFISGSSPLTVEPFVLETLSEGNIMNNDDTQNSDGSLPSGSEDNVRWEIVSPNTSSGTFSLLIRRGDDNTNSPVVLETWRDLSLDPFSDNYIEKAIGNQTENIATDGTDYYMQLTGSYTNQSKYVRIKTVNRKTPNYLDNSGDPVSSYTSSIPIVGSGSFGSAIGSNVPSTTGNYYENIDSNNTQGLIGTDYDDVINLLANKEEYQYKYITAPGLYDKNYSSQVSSIITKCRERGDTMAIIDTNPYGENISTVTSEASGINNSYASTYWPWVKTIDPNTGEEVWVPASTLMPGVYAFTDTTNEPWFAPAGTARGVISNATRAERKLTQSNRDTLYQNNVNPITTFPNRGVVVYGQKTLQKKKSALDRVDVRRLLIELKSFIGQVGDTLVFEKNTTVTRNEFLSQVNPYLSSVQQREGLTAFRVIMDETNNPPSTIDQNQINGQILIQPTRTIEFVQLDFTVTPSGATFE